MAFAYVVPDDNPSTYAWVIDTDHLAEPAAEPGSFCDNAATVTGPRNAPQGLLDRLAAGEGREFRIYDDDGEHYYTGRIAFTEPLLPLQFGEEAFGPLWDFGTPNAGATEIRYETNGKWETL